MGNGMETCKFICETNHQSRFDAWYRVLGSGAQGWPREMGWGGRWEGGFSWGTHIHPWRIHASVWQNQYSIVAGACRQTNRSQMQSAKYLRNKGSERMGLRGTEPALGWSQQLTTLLRGNIHIYMLTGLTKFSSKTCIRAESQTFAQEFYLNSLRLAKYGTGVLVWITIR